MKFLSLLLSPVVVLWIACAIVKAAWYYYLIAWFVGLGFGVLLIIGLFWLIMHRGESKRPDLKRTWESVQDDDDQMLFMQ